MRMALLWKKSLHLRPLSCQSRVLICHISAMRTDDEVKRIFDEWVVKHGRLYKTVEEREKRFQIFRDSLRRIDLHNSTGCASYTLGLNNFSDRTILELRSRMSYRPPVVPTDDEDTYEEESDEEVIDAETDDEVIDAENDEECDAAHS